MLQSGSLPHNLAFLGWCYEKSCEKIFVEDNLLSLPLTLILSCLAGDICQALV